MTTTSTPPRLPPPPGPAEAGWLPTDPGTLTETLPPDSLPFEQQIGAALDLSLPGELTTPVPPMPVTRILVASPSAGICGWGRPERSSTRFSGFRTSTPSTVTKLGQKPFTQL